MGRRTVGLRSGLAGPMSEWEAPNVNVCVGIDGTRNAAPLVSILAWGTTSWVFKAGLMSEWEALKVNVCVGICGSKNVAPLISILAWERLHSLSSLGVGQG